MQGRDKKSKVFHPWTQALGRGLHLEAVGFPWKALRLVLAAENRGILLATCSSMCAPADGQDSATQENESRPEFEGE